MWSKTILHDEQKSLFPDTCVCFANCCCLSFADVFVPALALELELLAPLLVADNQFATLAVTDFGVGSGTTAIETKQTKYVDLAWCRQSLFSAACLV